MIAGNKAAASRGLLSVEASMDVILAYDGSEHARAAVELVQDLQLSTESSITLMAVMPTQHIQGHEQLKAKLERTGARLAEGKAQVVTLLKAGNPAATINELANEKQTDLIVVGAKGLRATLGILLGGVAQQVVEYSCCPVLVVRAPFKGIKRVLLVTDGSDLSQRALEYLALPPGKPSPQFPLPPGAVVHIMHVLPPPVTLDGASNVWAVGPEVLFPLPQTEIDLEALYEQEEESGRALLDHALANLESAGIFGIGELKRGDAATVILEFARQKDIDLIICGSRGLSQVSGWLLGSVSRKLVHYSNCSVMVVKSKLM